MTIINVFVISPDTRSERRLDLHSTVEQLKVCTNIIGWDRSLLNALFQTKLEHITGIPVPNQTISLLASEDNPRLVANLTDDDKPLGFYGIQDWQVIKA